MAKTVVRLDDRKLKELIQASGQTVRGRIIADGVEYGIYVEMGTSKMAARPALVPAFEQHTRQLPRAVGQAIERQANLDDVIGKTAFDIQRDYQGSVPVRTGALKNSIHTEEQ